MAIKSRSYAERINDIKVMLAGLTANSERMGKRGIDADFITRLQTAHDEAKAIDNEQEALKARMKEKSEALTKKMEVLNGLYRSDSSFYLYSG